MTNQAGIHSSSCECCGDLSRRHFDRRLHLSAGAGLLATFPSLAFGAYGKYEAMLVSCQPKLKVELGLMALNGKAEMFS